MPFQTESLLKSNVTEQVIRHLEKDSGVISMAFVHLMRDSYVTCFVPVQRRGQGLARNYVC